ncbi:RNA 3'-terminal phosphate cyclase [Pendulispora albinea]|uniref:RNA 3'-terminal phosphate cyclase n=1 Tax=Pendulispora albinea TaxID=2741071 RepID=A0ABZ2M227_9BACT
MTEWLTIEGSMGEGGGQILRSSLALSLLTGTPIRIANIRRGRAKPGLMRQHLAAVQAAAQIGEAEVRGAEIGGVELEFHPKALRGGDYTFAIGGAGSTTLVFQTVFLPLLLGAAGPSQLTFEGGTHNPMAPPFDFLTQTFLPILARMGARVSCELTRYGFYPAGGGRWTATIEPAKSLDRLTLLERGDIRARRATALIAQVSPSVALRELDTLARALGWERAWCKPLMIERPEGPGNALLAIVESDAVTEIVAGFGERGVRAETVAHAVAAETARYIAANVPVGEHLADQLLLPMALGAGGAFRTVRPSTHCLTQIELLRLFLDVTITAAEVAPDVWHIEVPPARTTAHVR